MISKPKFCRCCDVFQFFSKNFIKLGGVLKFAFIILANQYQLKFCKFLDAALLFLQVTHFCKIVAHYNRNNTDIIITTYAESLVSKQYIV